MEGTKMTVLKPCPQCKKINSFNLPKTATTARVRCGACEHFFELSSEDLESAKKERTETEEQKTNEIEDKEDNNEEKTEEKQEKEIVFKKSTIGLKFKKGGVVTRVAQFGEAEENGVKIGWKIIKVNDEDAKTATKGDLSAQIASVHDNAQDTKEENEEFEWRVTFDTSSEQNDEKQEEKNENVPKPEDSPRKKRLGFLKMKVPKDSTEIPSGPASAPAPIASHETEKNEKKKGGFFKKKPKSEKTEGPVEVQITRTEGAVPENATLHIEELELRVGENGGEVFQIYTYAKKTEDTFLVVGADPGMKVEFAKKNQCIDFYNKLKKKLLTSGCVNSKEEDVIETTPEEEQENARVEEETKDVVQEEVAQEKQENVEEEKPETAACITCIPMASPGIPHDVARAPEFDTIFPQEEQEQPEEEQEQPEEEQEQPEEEVEPQPEEEEGEAGQCEPLPTWRDHLTKKQDVQIQIDFYKNELKDIVENKKKMSSVFSEIANDPSISRQPSIEGHGKNKTSNGFVAALAEADNQQSSHEEAIEKKLGELTGELLEAGRMLQDELISRKSELVSELQEINNALGVKTFSRSSSRRSKLSGHRQVGGGTPVPPVDEESAGEMKSSSLADFEVVKVRKSDSMKSHSSRKSGRRSRSKSVTALDAQKSSFTVAGASKESDGPRGVSCITFPFLRRSSIH